MRQENTGIKITNDECEIELQRNIMLGYKYYGHYVKSRKFNYRFIENNKGFGKVLISKDSGQKLVHFFAGLYLIFNLGKSTCFKVISQAFLGDAKVWSETGENMLNSRLMNLRISHGKYTLFSVNFFVGLRA